MANDIFEDLVQKPCNEGSAQCSSEYIFVVMDSLEEKLGNFDEFKTKQFR